MSPVSLEMKLIEKALSIVGQRQTKDVSSSSPSADGKKPRQLNVGLSEADKYRRRLLRNRESTLLSRERKLTRLQMLCDLLLDMKKNYSNLSKEAKCLRSNQERLMTENKRLREKLATHESSEPITTKNTNENILVKWIAVSDIQPSRNGRKQIPNIPPDVMLLDPVITKDRYPEPPQCDGEKWPDIVMSNPSKSFLKRCSLRETEEYSSKITEHIGLFNNGVKIDNPQSITKETESDNISDENARPHFSYADTRCEVEKRFENKNDALEQLIVVENAVVKGTTITDKHVHEICQEHNYVRTQNTMEI